MVDARTRRVHIAESSKTCNTIIGLKSADGDGDDDACVAGTNPTSDDGHANRPPASPYPSPLNSARPDDAPPLLDKPSIFPAYISTALENISKLVQLSRSVPGGPGQLDRGHTAPELGWSRTGWDRWYRSDPSGPARNEKRTTLTWSDFFASGFTRTDASAPPSNSPPVMTPKVKYKSMRQSRLTLPPVDLRTAISLWVYEEFVPTECRAQLTAPKRKITYHFKINLFR
ncbi:hypothetical protein M422DRAFT_257668 [Sphaerobolus stellatus SS14]|uniref:Uncharacterized protein n=1 Tax=Sphaerobolus stellatus (strain SS14) TaxID=990650 RepID=A0A0C9VDW2_SPHS4|nr:hypothetical protein M422DRAFT_257668 [Sphaerobolus stellatus SS14]